MPQCSRRTLLLAPATLLAARAGLEIHASIPSGNIRVERIEGDDVYIRQDLRDTEGDWFWWCFEVRCTQERTLRFHFTGSDVIGTRGPAVSKGSGSVWKWLGRSAVQGKTFTYRFDVLSLGVRFAFAMPYTEIDLQQFLKGRGGVSQQELCRTRKGRTAERLIFGSQSPDALKVLLTARHHACESMASYVLEGLMEAAIKDPWLKQNVQFAVIPFVDKDGVEDGDQGKNRRPRDHNRDYDGDSVHPSVATLRQWVPEWSAGKLAFALDLHCPWIRGPHNEDIYFPGGEDQRNWAEIVAFSRILEEVNDGPLPYSTSNNLPFGTSWNNASNYAQGMSFARWATALPGTRAAGTIEIPYANCGAVDVTPKSAHGFGHYLALALWRYLRR